MSDGLPGTAQDARPGDRELDADADSGVIPDPEPGPEAGEPVVRGLDRRRGVVGVLRDPRLAWAVAVLALALAAFAGIQWADLYAAERTRSEVRQEATGLVLSLTTFEGENIEEWVDDAQARATGEYAEQLETLFDQDLRDALREQEVVSRGEVDQLFVQDISEDGADVFALVTQTIVNASTADPVQDELRMDITMERVEGRWLASDVAVLGPSGLVGGAPPPPGDAPVEEGDQ